MPVDVGRTARPTTATYSEIAHLAQALEAQARMHPDRTVFVYLRDGETEERTLTNEQLSCRARTIAAHLLERGAAGKPVLLAYPPGLDFIEALFGCFFAGCIAVPTNLPNRNRRAGRFEAICNDCRPHLALSTSDAAAQFQSRKHHQNGRRSACAAADALQWIATDQLNEQADDFPIDSKDDRPAMLQYTSGSTSLPKGVVLSHANLIANAQAICGAFEATSNDSSVSWLPAYHDMGLIGNVIVPVLAGIRNVLMSPASFLQNPVTWLRAISRHGATISGGPNFAYDLCVRRITEEQRQLLDLSTWNLAFVGAEPVHAETLARFARAFAPHGFDPGAFYPCYGLAEATLMISGPKRGKGYHLRRSARTGHDLVSCGAPVESTRIAIVNPRTRTEVEDGKVGEIWVAGPSVGSGYWNKPGASRRCFGARLKSQNNQTFLRTGDLGVLHEGELYVAGRRDGLIIVRGVNHYPQDLETTARQSHPLLEPHRGAAFVVAEGRNEQRVLVHEVTRNGSVDLSPVLDAASTAVLDQHDVALDTIVLVRSGTIPRTSSGKIQRFACRDALLAGELHVLAERSCSKSSGMNGRNGHKTVGRRRLSHSSGESGGTGEARSLDDDAAFEVVCRHALSLSRSPATQVTHETPLSALGMDSLQRVELVTAIEKSLHRRLPNTCDVQTLGELAQLAQQDRRDGATKPKGDIPAEHYDIAQFPELVELERYESMLREIVGENPYFRIDAGNAKHSATLRIDGRELINFCGYDYIGMSRDPKVSAATKEAVDRYGTSAGASRLVSGEKQAHRDLEQALAEFIGTEDALVFVSGHATNVTTIGHLLGPGDLIVHDLLAHNSIIQGAKLSGADHRAFPHNDWEALDVLLSEVRRRHRRVLIAIEGVYSMDGDWPDLPRFVELRRKYKALLLVDEAHSIGTMGGTGRGIGEHYNVAPADVDLWMGTLSKSLASCGGFIAGSAALTKYLKFTAPGFVYSVGLSPANAGAAIASLELLKQEPHRVAELREKSELFLELARRKGLDTGLASGSPIVPVIVGNSIDTLRLAGALFDRGINVQPILRPAVPEDAARLRFFITVNHTRSHIEAAIDATAEELAKLRRSSGPT